MKSEYLIKEDLKYIWHPCSQMKDYEEFLPIVIERGNGSYLYDINGKEYIDIISSWWCNLLGHSNEKINAAIKKQLDKLEHVIFANFTHEPVINLCQKLVKVLPKGLCKFNFSDNGSASVECALKMAFQYMHQTGRPQKRKFMCLTDGYHGETLGALSVGTMDLYAKIYKPMLMESIQIEAPNCYRCPYGKNREDCNCECFIRVEETFENFASETCALILEPLLQGSAGMRIYPPLYLKKMRKICTQYDVLLIFDEIATGFGRTGKMFAADHANISPDIMTLSKGLTAGYMPMAITVTTQEIYDAFYDDYLSQKAFMHSHTYSGNPLGSACANAVLDILMNDNILDLASENSKYLNSKLKEELLDHKNIGEIRSLGLINAMELVNGKDTKESFLAEKRVGYEIYKEAIKKGLILRPLGNVLYFNPPLNTERYTYDKAIEICKDSIEKVLGK